jgi:hypothetical protein
VQELDRRILAFAGAHRFVLAEQIERFAEAESGLVAGRLTRLQDEERVRIERLGRPQLGLVRVTASGLRSIASRLPAPGFALGDYRHALGVVWLWVAAWKGAFGEAERVLSAREMQALDGAARELGEDDGRFSVPVAGAGLYPDVMASYGWGRGAIHLVTWPHRRVDLDALFAGYRRRPEVAEVVLMLVDDLDVGRVVSAAADRQGVADKVRVQSVVGQGTALPRGADSAG